MTKNQRAFLDMIAVSEGTSTSPATQNNGYDVIVTGIDGHPEVFTDYSDHPFANGRAPKVINEDGLKSTASGRYQIMIHWWPAYKHVLQLPDFGPLSQDAYALRQIQESHALVDIEQGNIAQAIMKCAHIWASLPGANYGQHENKMAALVDAYTHALNTQTG